MKKPIVKTLLLIVFAAVALFVFRQQPGEAYLKTGIARYEANGPTASPLLKEAARLAPGDPLAHRYYALALQKEAAAGAPDAGARLLEARAAILRGQALRADAGLWNLLGQNLAMEGNADEALAAYETAYFLEPRADEFARRTALLSGRRTAAIDALFRQGRIGQAAMMTYNLFAADPLAAKQTGAAALMRDLLLSLPPERWVGAATDADGPAMRALFSRLPPDERQAITRQLRESGLHAMAAFLEAA